MKPFCDFIGITVSADDWEALRLDITPEMDAIGMGVEIDDSRRVLWRSSDSTGTVKATRVGRVWALGCSGAACTGLRAAGRFNSYLAAIGARPHRVTRLDATIDIPIDAAPIVSDMTMRGRSGELTLTRKSIKPSDVTSFTGVREDGAVTGTVYLGPRRADVRMVVYDKQHERMSRKLPDCGPLTRYELRLRSGTGVTLRDASDPSGVFWHYASPDFLNGPDGVLPWAPDGSGFDLPRVAPLLPYQRLLRRIDASTDLASLVALAESCGPRGVEFLISRIRRIAGGAGVSPADTLPLGAGQPGYFDAATLPTAPEAPPRHGDRLEAHWLA